MRPIERRALSILFAASTISACMVAAQTSSPTPSQPPPQKQLATPPPAETRPAPTNLKALPKTTTSAEIEKLMRQYSGDLGVGCDFCHAPRVAGARPDRASDANPMKDTARYMITMTADLNDHWLTDMPDRRYADPITCGTCHRGEKHPSIFVPPARPEGMRPAGPPPTGPPPAHPPTS